MDHRLSFTTSPRCPLTGRLSRARVNTRLLKWTRKTISKVRKQRRLLVQWHSRVYFYLFAANSRRSLLGRESPIGSSDRDENKYKRKTPLELLMRWSRRFYSPSSRPPWRRTWFLVLVGIFLFLLLIYIMAKLGRGGDDENGSFEEDFRHNR